MKCGENQPTFQRNITTFIFKVKEYAKQETSNKQKSLLHAGFLLGSFFDLENEGGNVSLKCQLTFTRLHSIIPQKTEPLILAAVRISYC
jgi:hypothetical protein